MPLSTVRMASCQPGKVLPIAIVQNYARRERKRERERQAKSVRTRKTLVRTHTNKLQTGAFRGLEQRRSSKRGRPRVRFSFDVQVLRMISLKFVIDCGSYETTRDPLPTSRAFSYTSERISYWFDCAYSWKFRSKEHGACRGFSFTVFVFFFFCKIPRRLLTRI